MGDDKFSWSFDGCRQKVIALILMRLITLTTSVFDRIIIALKAHIIVHPSPNSCNNSKKETVSLIALTALITLMKLMAQKFNGEMEDYPAAYVKSRKWQVTPSNLTSIEPAHPDCPSYLDKH